MLLKAIPPKIELPEKNIFICFKLTAQLCGKKHYTIKACLPYTPDTPLEIIMDANSRHPGPNMLFAFTSGSCALKIVLLFKL